MSDALMLLQIQLEWGADEALGPSPTNWLAEPRAMRAPPAPVPAPRAGGVVARAEAVADGCGDLDALRAGLEGFDVCPLRETAGHLAFADGPVDARLLTVIEAPSTEDDATGIPLSGKLGALFDSMVSSVGIPRQTVRIACLVPWRPPGGRSPSVTEVAMCRPFLLAQIRLLPAVTHIVLLGATVTKAIAGVDGQVRQLRGSWLDLSVDQRSIRGLVMSPLPAIAAEPRQKSAAWSDLLRLRRSLDAR